MSNSSVSSDSTANVSSPANTGPKVWAFLSLVGGLALAYPFLRREDVAESPQAEFSAVGSGSDVIGGSAIAGGSVHDQDPGHQIAGLRNDSASHATALLSGRSDSDWQIDVGAGTQGASGPGQRSWLDSTPQIEADGSDQVGSVVADVGARSQAIKQPESSLIAESVKPSEASNPSVATPADAQSAPADHAAFGPRQANFAAINPNSLPSTGSKLPPFTAQQPPLPHWVKGESSLDELIGASPEQPKHYSGADDFGKLNATKPAPFQPWQDGVGKSSELRQGEFSGLSDATTANDGDEGRGSDLASRYSPWGSSGAEGTRAPSSLQRSDSLALQRPSGWPDRSITINWDALASAPAAFSQADSSRVSRVEATNSVRGGTSRAYVPAASSGNATFGTRLVTGPKASSSPTIGAILDREAESSYAPRVGGVKRSGQSSSNVIRQPGMQPGM